jgi:hypothetical protein
LQVKSGFLKRFFALGSERERQYCMLNTAFLFAEFFG